MAIVKMRHVRLVAMQKDREDLLRLFQRMGCVEIDEPSVDWSDPVWADLTRPDGSQLARLREGQTAGEKALSVLKRYAPEKGGFFRSRPVLTEGQFFDQAARERAELAAGEINETERKINVLYAEQSKMNGQKAALVPWLPLDISLDSASTPGITVQFGTVPATVDVAALEGEVLVANELSQMTTASSDQELHYLLVVCHSSGAEAVDEVLKNANWSRIQFRDLTGTAQENTKRLAIELDQVAKELAQSQSKVEGMGPCREDLRQLVDRFAREIEREEAKGRLLDTQATFFLDGWVPVENQSGLQTALGQYLCAWDYADPVPEEYPQVPVKLKNNALSGSMNMVTEMYGLPAYDGVDPNPLMWPFFTFFFGFMFADFGYGLLMVIGGLFYKKKVRPKGTMGGLIEMVIQCGVATAAIGFLTGGFFSNSIATVCDLLGVATPQIPFLTVNPIFDIMTQPMEILVLTMGIGLIQIVTGMAVHVYMLVREGKWMEALCGEVAWWVVFICIGASAVTGNWNIMWVALAVILLTQGYGKKGIGGKIIGIIASLYNNVTGYFGDILSYSRLMVMMLAGSVIGQVFNLLGAMAGTIWVFIPVFLIGHAFNIGLNVIGTYVHTSRLQYLEYFKTFYKEGGRPFNPLSFNKTQYVDILKEEQ